MKYRNLVAACALALAGCASAPDDAENIDKQEQPIVGGRAAPVERYPWFVQLYNSSNTLWCGGSLIAPNWAVTAAHCGTPAYVRVGATRAAARVERLRVIRHPSYNSSTLENDIQLIELRTSVAATPIPLNVDRGWPRAVELATATAADSNVTAAGFGLTREGGSGSNTLLEVDVPVITDASCDAAYTRQTFATNICAGLAAGGRDACQGDSGGPLINRGMGRDILVGITSWGVGCARANQPGVYTQVSEYVDWIRNQGVPVTTQSPTALIMATLSTLRP